MAMVLLVGRLCVFCKVFEMDKKEFKLKLINYVSNNQQIISGFVALLATVIIVSVLFANTAVGVVDYGEYTQTLYDMGLAYTDEVLADGESLYFTRETLIN